MRLADKASRTVGSKKLWREKHFEYLQLQEGDICRAFGNPNRWKRVSKLAREVDAVGRT